MPKSATVPLGSIARLLSGGTPSKSNPAFWNGTIPWLTPKDMVRWNGTTEEMVSTTAVGNGTKLAPQGAIFIAVRGMSLHTEIRVVKSSQALTFNQDIKAIVPSEGIDGDFLYYVLLSKKANLLASVEPSGHGTGVLHTERLTSLSVPMVSLNEQRLIASILVSLDKKIDCNQRMNKTLESLATATFKEWFVDFGPTRAKLDGRAPYLESEIWSLFPDTLDESSNPDGWTTSTIGEEVEVVGGSTPSTKDPAYWGGDIAWATPKDLSSLSTPVLLSTDRRITEEGLAQIGSGLLPIGTVLLSSRAPIGYVAITQIPVAVNQGFIAMSCKKRLSSVFVWLWTHANIETVHQNANGSTFQEISKANFRPIAVKIPAPELLRAFDRIVSPMFEQIVSNEKETKLLAATRDLVLSKLISGEIRVADAEKQVGIVI